MTRDTIAATESGTGRSTTRQRISVRTGVLGVLTASIVAAGLAWSSSPAFAGECAIQAGEQRAVCGEVTNESDTAVKVAPNRSDPGEGRDDPETGAKITEIKNGESSTSKFKDADAYLVPVGCKYTLVRGGNAEERMGPRDEISNGWVPISSAEKVVITSVTC